MSSATEADHVHGGQGCPADSTTGSEAGGAAKTILTQHFDRGMLAAFHALRADDRLKDESLSRWEREAIMDEICEKYL